MGIGAHYGLFRANYYLPLVHKKRVIEKNRRYKKILQIASGFDARFAWKRFNIGYLRHTDKDSGLIVGINHRLGDFLLSLETLQGKNWKLGITYSLDTAKDGFSYNREHIMRFKESTVVNPVTLPPVTVTPPTPVGLRFPDHPSLVDRENRQRAMGYTNFACRGNDPTVIGRPDLSCANTLESNQPDFTDRAVLYCLRQNLGEGQPQNCVLAYFTDPPADEPRPSQNPFTLLEIYPDDPSVAVSVRLRTVTGGVVPNDLVTGEQLVSTGLNGRGDTVSRYSGEKLYLIPRL